MFNVGGPEFLVILLVALIVLGPSRLPDAARQVGKFMGEMKRMSSGFQQEFKNAIDDGSGKSARTKGASLAAKRAKERSAKAAGARIVRELVDTDYGSRDYAARDPEGHLWSFGTYQPFATQHPPSAGDA